MKTKHYPWISAKAKCGMCKSLMGINCLKGNKVKFPLMTIEHNCKDYIYEPDSKDTI